MIILDTNVLAALMRTRPDPSVRAWADALNRSTIYSTSITIYEISFGIGRLPAGQKKQRLLASWGMTYSEFLDGRILPVDEAAGMCASRLRIEALAAGNNCDICDILIAGIAVSRRAAVATRNIRHYENLPLELIDPWAIDENGDA